MNLTAPGRGGSEQSQALWWPSVRLDHGCRATRASLVCFRLFALARSTPPPPPNCRPSLAWAAGPLWLRLFRVPVCGRPS
ncbi:hypothetical protein LX36DRAFT_260226 [Colletotrichum falcatum]|nr:hypothetical protein LX36DRAFT_260226 [Colletotrichum falcatum]